MRETKQEKGGISMGPKLSAQDAVNAGPISKRKAAAASPVLARPTDKASADSAGAPSSKRRKASEIDDIFNLAKTATADTPAPDAAAVLQLAAQASKATGSKSNKLGSHPVQNSIQRSDAGDDQEAGNTEDEGGADAADVSHELQQIAERIRAARAASAQRTAAQKQAPAGSSKKAKVSGSKDDPFGTDQKGSGRKRTEEGYVIYGEDELGLTKKGGGDTALCPFDCDCCF